MYIFDLDGTLADCTHRLHHIQDKPKDWKAFFAGCADDKPIPEVIKVLQALNEFNKIFIISGRSDECEEQTIEWLDRNQVWPEAIYMRKAGDHRQDNIVKSELLDNLLEDWDDEKVEGIFEDRQQVVDMYRARGFRVFQVAEGNF